MKKEIIREIIEETKQKKEYAYLDEELITKAAAEFSRKNHSIARKIDEEGLKKKYKKDIVKFIRNKYRSNYAVFNTRKLTRRESLLEKARVRLSEGKQSEANEILDELTKFHISSKERYLEYPALVDKLNSENAKTIIDISCGINPLALVLHGFSGKIRCSELSQEDCNFLNRFFEIFNIDGICKKLDLENPEAIDRFVDVNIENGDDDLKSGEFFRGDVALIFKTIDLIPSSSTERLITALDVNKIIVSFPKTTVSGKKMNQIRRSGFQKMLRRLEMEYHTFEIGEEIFYEIIK